MIDFPEEVFFRIHLRSFMLNLSVNCFWLKSILAARQARNWCVGYRPHWFFWGPLLPYAFRSGSLSDAGFVVVLALCVVVVEAIALQFCLSENWPGGNTFWSNSEKGINARKSKPLEGQSVILGSRCVWDSSILCVQYRTEVGESAVFRSDILPRR